MRVPAKSSHRRPATFGRALLGCIPAALVLGAAAIAATVDTSADSRSIGYAVGIVAFPLLVAALVLWLIARRRRSVWPYWKLLVVGTVLVFVIQLFALAGQMT